MEGVNLQNWNFIPSIIAFFALIVVFSFFNVIDRPTRDILLENDEEIKKQLKKTNDFVHEYLPKILEAVKKK